VQQDCLWAAVRKGRAVGLPGDSAGASGTFTRVVWIPYADEEQRRFDELAALYLISRKRLQEINIETQMVASPGSVAHRDEQALLSHDPPVPGPALHLITFTAQSYLHAASEHMTSLGALSPSGGAALTGGSCAVRD